MPAPTPSPLIAAAEPARHAPELRPVTPASIIAARLARAVELAELLDTVVGEHGAVGDLLSELRGLRTLASGLEPYVEAVTSPRSPRLDDLVARTQAHDWAAASALSPVPVLEAEMLSGHVEGQFLRFLVAMTRARQVLEIGMFTGYSALAMAEALGPDGRLVACEIDPAVAAFAQATFDDATGPGAQIDVRVGPALDTLAELAASRASGPGGDVDAGMGGAAVEGFDLIFIDADKPGYLAYYETILDSGLLNPGGTICVDNTLHQGDPWSIGPRSVPGEAISAFNAAVAADPRVEQVLIPLRDGVTLIRSRG